MESLETSSASVKNEFQKFKQERVLSEYIWNSFDANASEVNIKFSANETGTLESLSVSDDGLGIDPEEHEETFGKFKDSPKKRVSSPTIKGQKGLGRFSFHKIAKAAIWDSVSEKSSCSIVIDSEFLNNYEVNHKRDIFNPVKTGTNVEFIGVYEHNLSEDFVLNRIQPSLSKEFSWLIASSKKKNIYINGNVVPILNHIHHTESINVGGYVFDISVYIWDEKPNENSYIYFSDANEKIILKEHSKQNLKAGFYSSAYVASDFFNGFNDKPDDLLSTLDNNEKEILREIKEKAFSLLKDLYAAFRNEAADKLIEQYESEGIFPEYKNDSIPLKRWKDESLKNTIRVLYGAEPSLFSSHLNKTQKRIIIKLLDKLTVSPNDDLFDVLNGVVSLDHEEQRKLADILKETSLGNITNAISEIRSRKKVIDIINELNEEHSKTTKEVGEIQTVVENNLWLFGEKYHLLTAEEPDFEQALRELLAINGNEKYYQKGSVTHSDKNKEMDVFAIRRNFDVDEKGNEFYRCLVVELKRPSDTLKDKHLDQIQKYFKVINSNHQFNDGLHKWDFILAGRKITDDSLARTMIDASLENSKSHAEKGLVMKAGNFSIFIKPWSQIFSEHNIRHKHLLNHLEFDKAKITGTRSELVRDAQNIGSDIKRKEVEPESK
ncbi:ATP-binding protein [Halomonas sp. IOP_14]|uniref:ATP-binding protein n=1 Tax=Halomonas sp. IOP_14 TaxID=2873295 RepID=UPI001E571077|nr:ATP-binding protein [Halomonas sp. IOP_14]MCD1585514.1 ATP-binding protein [Halomonas sp. IOP_14]